jgi:hypothetical protein
MGIANKTENVIEMVGKAVESWRNKSRPVVGMNMNYIKENILPAGLTLGAAGLVASQTDNLMESGRDLISDIKYKLTADKKLDKLVELQPSLSLFDREKIKLYYEQLRHFAPDVAANDLAAASYIRHALAMHDQGIPIATYDILTKTQKQMGDSSSKKGKGIFGSALVAGGNVKPTEYGYSTDFSPFFPKD